MNIGHRCCLIAHFRFPRIEQRQGETGFDRFLSECGQVLIEAGDRGAFALLHRAGFIKDECDVERLGLVFRIIHNKRLPV